MPFWSAGPITPRRLQSTPGQASRDWNGGASKQARTKQAINQLRALPVGAIIIHKIHYQNTSGRAVVMVVGVVVVVAVVDQWWWWWWINQWWWWWWISGGGGGGGSVVGVVVVVVTRLLAIPFKNTSGRAPSQAREYSQHSLSEHRPIDPGQPSKQLFTRFLLLPPRLGTLQCGKMRPNSSN